MSNEAPVPKLIRLEGIMSDPEIEVMSVLVAALDKLDDDHDKRARVLRWAADRYGVSLAAPPAPAKQDGAGSSLDTLSNPSQRVAEPTPRAVSERSFDDFVDLFDAVDPRTDVEKALTGAYWLQVISGQPTWQSLRVNNLLKDTGHGVANVTSALRVAQNRKPALVRQVHKSGKSVQSWKTYKLTTSGVAYMRRKLGLTGSVPSSLSDNGEEADL
jgi:hypothetical protein